MAPPAPPHPAAPLGGRDPRPSARPQGRREAARRPGGFLSPRRLGQLRGGRRERQGRAAGLRARLSPPARGGWQGSAPWRPVGTEAGRRCPAALGTGRFLRASTSFSPTGVLTLLSPPPFCPCRSLLSLLHGAEGEGQGGPGGAGASRGRASRRLPEPALGVRPGSVLLGALPLLPSGAPRPRGEALEGRRGYSALSGFDPCQCRDAGLAPRCEAGSRRVIRVISVIVIISPFPCGCVSLHHFQTSPL